MIWMIASYIKVNTTRCGHCKRSGMTKLGYTYVCNREREMENKERMLNGQNVGKRAMNDDLSQDECGHSQPSLEGIVVCIFETLVCRRH